MCVQLGIMCVQLGIMCVQLYASFAVNTRLQSYIRLTVTT